MTGLEAAMLLEQIEQLIDLKIAAALRLVTDDGQGELRAEAAQVRRELLARLVRLEPGRKEGARP